MSENVKPETVRESLANYAHEAWAGWMKYLFGKSIDMSSGAVVIPGKLVKRWTRQMNTPYSGLPENEKESDRAEADKILEISGFASLTEDLARAENAVRNLDREAEDSFAEILRLQSVLAAAEERADRAEKRSQFHKDNHLAAEKEIERITADLLTLRRSSVRVDVLLRWMDPIAKKYYHNKDMAWFKLWTALTRRLHRSTRSVNESESALLKEAEEVFINEFRKPSKTKALVDAFLAWELPQSVCADQCATMKDYPHKRYGTHLLTATEARMMIAHLMAVATRRSTTNTKGE